MDDAFYKKRKTIRANVPSFFVRSLELKFFEITIKPSEFIHVFLHCSEMETVYLQRR